MLVTDLAPADLVLQRAGRLHRHQRGVNQSQRPAGLRQARCFITGVDWTAIPPEPAAGSVRVYTRHPLLRSLAVLEPYLNGGLELTLPEQIAPIVQDAYGDTPLGPQAWQQAMTQALEEHDILQQQKQRKAEAFR